MKVNVREITQIRISCVWSPYKKLTRRSLQQGLPKGKSFDIMRECLYLQAYKKITTYTLN